MNCPPAVPHQAALQLKNLIRTHPAAWRQLDAVLRSDIKQALLDALRVEERCSAGLSQCLHAAAELELADAAWPQIIPALLEVSTGAHFATKNKIRAMETIGYICETVGPERVEENVDQLLTAVVHCARCEGERDLMLAAVNALNNALEFAAVNFARSYERNYLLQVASLTYLAFTLFR